MVKVFPVATLARSVFFDMRLRYLSAALVSKHRGYPSIDQESLVYWTEPLFVLVGIPCLPQCYCAMFEPQFSELPVVRFRALMACWSKFLNPQKTPE